MFKNRRQIGSRAPDFHSAAKSAACKIHHIVNQAGHHSFRERAAEFNRVVTEFIEGVAHGD